MLMGKRDLCLDRKVMYDFIEILFERFQAGGLINMLLL